MCSSDLLLLPQAPTDHQRATLLALERQGVGVARLEQALHGPEWDEMLAQARTVLLLAARTMTEPPSALGLQAPRLPSVPIAARFWRATPPMVEK